MYVRLDFTQDLGNIIIESCLLYIFRRQLLLARGFSASRRL